MLKQKEEKSIRVEVELKNYFGSLRQNQSAMTLSSQSDCDLFLLVFDFLCLTGNATIAQKHVSDVLLCTGWSTVLD